MTAEAKNAYVTLVTNHDYADAAIALVRSLALTGTKADIVVMHTGAVEPGDLAPLTALGARCVEAELLDTSPEFNARHQRDRLHADAPFTKGNKPAFHTPLDNFAKLRLWELVEYENVVFIDADALVLKNLKQDVIIADSEWARLQTARQQGIETWFGEVLSDMAEEAMALDNIYTVLAATGNNHYNSMVCNHYAPHIGRHRVFQPHDAGSDREKHQVPETRRGITAFSQPVSYAEMWTRLIRGLGFRKTSITDSFSEAAFLESLPDNAVQLALIPENGKLEWMSKGTRHLQRGDVVVSFVPAEAKSKPAKADKPSSAAEIGPTELPG